MDLNKILTDLQYRAVGLNPDTGKLQEGYFVSFQPIGLSIRVKDFGNPTSFYKEENPDNEEKVTSRDENLQRTFDLSNEKIRMSSNLTVETSTQKVDETWKAIIEGATLDLDSTSLNDEQQQLFDEIEVKITAEMEDGVDDAEDAVLEAMEALQDKYTEITMEGTDTHSWKSIGTIYQKRVDRARSKLRRKSRKYNQYTAILESNGIDPTTLFISRAKAQFETNSIQLGTSKTLPYTYMIPSNWYDPDVNEGWNVYKETSFHEKKDSKTTKMDINASLGFSFGIFSPKKNGGYKSTKTTVNVKSNDLTIEFSYLIVKVRRNWMDSSLLNTKNWFLKSSSNANKYEKNCISDGTFEQTYINKPNQFLPSVITSVILIKDLTIMWKEDTLDTKHLEKAIKGGMSVSWGPFKLFDGSADKTTTTDTSKIKKDTKSLTIEGIQLIGFVSEILPASPFMSSK